MTIRATPDDTMRLDVAALRRPVLLADGSLRVDAVVAYVGRDLPYPWGVETPTEEALSDPEYLDACRGLAVTVHHPKGGRAKVGDGLRIGTITDARYDEADRATIRELTITDPVTIRRILDRELTEISEGYDVPRAHRRVAEDGRIEQLKRVPQHYSLTTPGRARMRGATLHLDEDDTMDKEEIAAMIAAALAPLMERMDAYGERLDAMDKPEVTEEVDIEERMDERAADIAEQIIDIRVKAGLLGIDIPADVRGLDAIAKHVAVKAGGEEARCDSLDYCHGVIAVAKPPKTADSWRPNSTDGHDRRRPPC